VRSVHQKIADLQPSHAPRSSFHTLGVKQAPDFAHVVLLVTGSTARDVQAHAASQRYQITKDEEPPS